MIEGTDHSGVVPKELPQHCQVAKNESSRTVLTKYRLNTVHRVFMFHARTNESLSARGREMRRQKTAGSGPGEQAGVPAGQPAD